MAGRRRGFSLASVSQAKVTFLDEISYTKLPDSAVEETKIGNDKGDKTKDDKKDKTKDDKEDKTEDDKEDNIEDDKEDKTKADKEDKAVRKRCDSKIVTFRTPSRDQLDDEKEPNNDVCENFPVELRQGKTSGHWRNSRGGRHRNASSLSRLSILSTLSSVGTEVSDTRSAANFKLSVLKIVFVNILFSLVNKAFDFSQVKI